MLKIYWRTNSSSLHNTHWNPTKLNSQAQFMAFNDFYFGFLFPLKKKHTLRNSTPATLGTYMRRGPHIIRRRRQRPQTRQTQKLWYAIPPSTPPTAHTPFTWFYLMPSLRRVHPPPPSHVPIPTNIYRIGIKEVAQRILCVPQKKCNTRSWPESVSFAPQCKFWSWQKYIILLERTRECAHVDKKFYRARIINEKMKVMTLYI